MSRAYPLARLLCCALAIACEPAAEPAAKSADPASTPRPEPEAVEPSSEPPEPSVPSSPSPVATAVGTPLHQTRAVDGLHWTIDTHLEQAGSRLTLVAEIVVRNEGARPAAVSLHPPRATVQIAPLPGTDPGDDFPLGIRGEGWGSSACSPAHGGPAMLPPGEHRTIERRVDLDPLPWPEGQAFRVGLDARDCRSSARVLSMLDALVVPPTGPEAPPTLLAAEAPAAAEPHDAPPSDGDAP